MSAERGQDVTAPDTTPAMRRVMVPAAVLGVLGLAACALGWVTRPTDFFRGYLMGYVFWLGVPVGSIGFLLLHPLTGGRWGRPLRPVMEAAALSMPLVALLFVPVLLGMSRLYVWTHAGVAHGHHVAEAALAHKAAWLTAPGFVSRSVLYLAVLCVLAYLIVRLARRRDEGLGSARAVARLAGPGMVLLFLTGTFMAIDWIMTLEPLWFSTIYGLYVLVGMGLTAMCFAVVVAVAVNPVGPPADPHGRHPPASAGLDRDLLHDLGKLLFMLINLFAYIAFSQFLIIWSGNLPEETLWYTVRNDAGLRPIPVFLVVAHFALPFLVLLSRHGKRRAGIVIGVALALLAVHWVNVAWEVLPAFRVNNALFEGGSLWAHLEGEPGDEGVSAWTIALALAATAGIGGVLLAAIAYLMAGRPPMAPPEVAAGVPAAPPQARSSGGTTEAV